MTLVEEEVPALDIEVWHEEWAWDGGRRGELIEAAGFARAGGVSEVFEEDGPGAVWGVGGGVRVQVDGAAGEIHCMRMRRSEGVKSESS